MSHKNSHYGLNQRQLKSVRAKSFIASGLAFWFSLNGTTGQSTRLHNQPQLLNV